jgi:PTH1 family peptidyl-tRNA hydrolase
VAFRLIVGLGNPGARYVGTRHNIGFEVLDAWAAVEKASFHAEKTGPADMARLGEARLIKPLTFMNVSGTAVRDWMEWLKLSPADLLVVVDDVQLALGQVRLRKSGSSGGHNGLRSVEAELGTADYARLRCGVGPLPEGWAMEDFVLSRFAAGDAESVKEMTAKAVEAVRSCQSEGIEVAMNRFNRRQEEQQGE